MEILYEKCMRCGRKLKTEESKRLGYGKTCWEKFNEDNFQELFPRDVLQKMSQSNKGAKNATV